MWLPTWVGAILLVVMGAVPVGAWACYGESFLSATHRINADGLIVEGWIGIEGIRAAAEEFRHGGEHYIITTGSPSSGTWNEHPISYAAMAKYELVRAGVPPEQIIVAATPAAATQRTFTAAMSVDAALTLHSLHPERLNLFTYGVHARRSRLVFSRVLGSKVALGVIAWCPAHHSQGPWWRSSDRAIDFLIETIAYPYEFLFESGRAMATHRWQSPKIHES